MYIQHSFHVPLASDQGVRLPVPSREVFHFVVRGLWHWAVIVMLLVMLLWSCVSPSCLSQSAAPATLTKAGRCWRSSGGRRKGNQPNRDVANDDAGDDRSGTVGSSSRAFPRNVNEDDGVRKKNGTRDDTEHRQALIQVGFFTQDVKVR
uniref:Uncharacterized protein n=1 Tax=Anopheles culicifacies TaxID=139723 RepID=A0A182MHL3_9DIPT